METNDILIKEELKKILDSLELDYGEDYDVRKVERLIKGWIFLYILI